MQKINEGDLLKVFKQGGETYFDFIPAAATTFTNTQQSYTATCPSGTTGTAVTKTIPAGTVTSSVSQADADAKALNMAQQQAQAAIVCTPNQPPSGGGNTIVIRLRGQSNMVGLGDFVSYPTTPGAVELKLLSQDLNAGTEQWGLVPANEPTGFTVQNVFGTNPFSKSRDFSLALPLIKRLKELTNVPNIIIFKTAQGNADLSVFEKGGGSYDLELRGWKWLKDNAAANGYTISHVFDLWLQGESDAVNGTTRDNYFVRLDKHVNDVIADFGVERFFIDRVGYDPTAKPNSEEIMLSQTLLGLTKPQVIVSNLAGAGYTIANGGLKSDGVHRTSQSLINDGIRDAEAIAYYLNTGNKLAFNAEPVSSLPPIYNDPTVIAKYQAMVVPAPGGGPTPTPAEVYQFDFTTGSVNEVSNKVGVRVIDLNGTVKSPTFSNGLVLDGNTVLEFSRLITSNKMTIELSGTITGSDYNWFISPGGTFPSYYNKSGISVPENTILISPNSTFALAFKLPNGFNFNLPHNYKIVLDGANASAFVDNQQLGVPQGFTNVLSIGWFGAGHPTPLNNIHGTITSFKISTF
jgi:hypothetical protein